MEISEITNPDEFGAMRDEWNALVDVSGNPLPYSRHEWLWAWWRNYGVEGGLRVVCVREGGALKAALALRTVGFRLKGLWGCRAAMPIGQGEAAYQDVPLARGFELKAINGMLAFLRKKHPDWDALVLRKLHPDSIWLSWARHPSRGVAALTWQERTPVPYIRLPDTPDEFEAGLGKGTRKSTRGDLRKLEQEGSAEFASADTVPAIRGAWPRFAQMHEAKWGLENLLAIGYARYKPFVEDLLAGFGEAGLARLLYLQVDGKPVAANLCFDFCGVRHVFMHARDPEYQERGVGRIVYFLTLRDAILAGLERADLGGGTEEYKYLFAPYTHATQGLVVPLKPGLKGRLLAFLESRER